MKGHAAWHLAVSVSCFLLHGHVVLVGNCNVGCCKVCCACRAQVRWGYEAVQNTIYLRLYATGLERHVQAGGANMRRVAALCMRAPALHMS